MKQLNGDSGPGRSPTMEKASRRALKFKDFYRTMSFVNALAHFANIEDHHPDLRSSATTTAASPSRRTRSAGCRENDFICAAKLDQL